MVAKGTTIPDDAADQSREGQYRGTGSRFVRPGAQKTSRSLQAQLQDKWSSPRTPPDGRELLEFSAAGLVSTIVYAPSPPR